MSVDLYLPSTLDATICLKAKDINKSLDQNIAREIENQFGNTFRKAGYIRPGSTRLIKRSLCGKYNTSDFTGKLFIDVRFRCDIYLPKDGQQVEIRVRSINKIGILGVTENGKLTVMISKKYQEATPEVLNQVSVGQRVLVAIKHFKINGQNNTIVAIADLVEILEGVYQNYQ